MRTQRSTLGHPPMPEIIGRVQQHLTSIRHHPAWHTGPTHQPPGPPGLRLDLVLVTTLQTAAQRCRGYQDAALALCADTLRAGHLADAEFWAGLAWARGAEVLELLGTVTELLRQPPATEPAEDAQ